MRAAGVRPGDRVHNATGYGLFTGGLGFHAGAERLGCMVIPVSGGMTDRQVLLIRDLEPEVITATPSYMLVIVDEIERQGIDPRSTSLQVGIFGAEPWTNEMRVELEARLDIHAIDMYGLSEVMGPGVACECIETKDGPHLWEDHFWPEIIDPVTDEVLADGEVGELVLTTLTRRGMPMIRYRTRDLTRLLPGTARTMRRIAKVIGRSDDMMIVRGVNVFPTQIEELILATPGLSPHFQCVLTRPGRMDELTVRVERRPGRDGDVAATAGRGAPGAGEEPHRRHDHGATSPSRTASNARRARCAASSTNAEPPESGRVGAVAPGRGLPQVDELGHGGDEEQLAEQGLEHGDALARVALRHEVAVARRRQRDEAEEQVVGDRAVALARRRTVRSAPRRGSGS